MIRKERAMTNRNCVTWVYARKNRVKKLPHGQLSHTRKTQKSLFSPQFPHLFPGVLVVGQKPVDRVRDKVFLPLLAKNEQSLECFHTTPKKNIFKPCRMHVHVSVNAPSFVSVVVADRLITLQSLRCVFPLSDETREKTLLRICTVYGFTQKSFLLDSSVFT